MGTKMYKKADSVDIWSRYLKGTPAQKIYTPYKKALSEESRAMQFSQKMEFYLMAKDDDELMAAIACFKIVDAAAISSENLLSYRTHG